MSHIPGVRVATIFILALAMFWNVFAYSYPFPWNLPVFIIGFGFTATACAYLVVRRLRLMGQLGIIQDIKCRFGKHVMNTFNHYTRDNWNLYYTNICINCCRGTWKSFVRRLTERERGLPIWEILGTTQEVYYGDDKRALIPYLEVPGQTLREAN